MPDDGFDLVPLPLAAHALEQLMRRVTENHHRVEIVDPKTGSVCLLVSKAELDCLESALESLSQLPAVSRLHQDVRRLAQLANESDFVPVTPALSPTAPSRLPTP
jgi:hypothetical protein